MGRKPESRIADNGAITHMAPSPDHLYNKRPPSPEKAKIFIGDGTERTDSRERRLEYVGAVDLIFHSTEDARVTLENVYFIPSFKINLLSPHTSQAKEAITPDATGAHLMGGRLFLPKDRAGPRLDATRSPPPPSYFPPLRGAPALMALMQPLNPPPPRAPVPVTVQPVRTLGVSATPPSPGVMVTVEDPLVAGFPPFRSMLGMPVLQPTPLLPLVRRCLSRYNR